MTALREEPTLADVLRDLWRARVVLLAGALAGFLRSLVFLWAAVPQYSASMLVGPAARSGGAPDMAALFPGNASVAMDFVLQSLNPGDSSDFTRFQAILREPTVAGLVLADREALDGLEKARRWTFSGGRIPQNAADLAQWLDRHIAVEPVGATRLQRVTFQHPDPVFAVHMLQVLYDDADGLIRKEAETKTASRIGYLEKELAEAVNPDHRRALAKLLEDQEQVAMILAAHEPYAAVLAEPPAVAPKPYWPRKAVVIPCFLLGGMLLAFVINGFRKPQ